MTDLRRDEALEIEQAIVRQIQEDTATKLGVGIVINTGSIAARIRPALVRRDADNARLLQVLLVESSHIIKGQMLQAPTFRCGLCLSEWTYPAEPIHKPNCFLQQNHPGARLYAELEALRNCAHGRHAGDQAAGGEFVCTVCGFVIVSAEDTSMKGKR